MHNLTPQQIAALLKRVYNEYMTLRERGLAAEAVAILQAELVARRGDLYREYVNIEGRA